MNSQQLQCFIYAAERLNFTKAAEALYLSVPTVTHHIKSLEDEIGVPLFYRNSHIVKLTKQGEKFYYNAKDIFLRMEDSKNQFKTGKKQDMITFRIGCMTKKEFEILECVLKHMNAEYPYVIPKVIVKSFFDLKNLYENQQLEAVISSYGLSVQGSYKRITDYRTCAVMPCNHLLANEHEIKFGQIAEENLITLQPKYVPFQKGNKIQEYITLHAQDHIHIVSEDENEGLLLVKCGYGIALLPEFYIPKDTETVSVPIENTNNINYGIYYRNNEKYTRYFIKEYLKAFSDLHRL